MIRTRLAFQATRRLLGNRRLWLGPDRLGHLIEVLGWLDDQLTERGL